MFGYSAGFLNTQGRELEPRWQICFFFYMFLCTNEYMFDMLRFNVQ